MPRFRADLQLSRADVDTPEKEHKKAFRHEAAFKAPHNPKVVGSSPASATKSEQALYRLLLLSKLNPLRWASILLCLNS